MNDFHGRMEALMGENDVWTPAPGTQFICGNCGSSYPLYGDHRCSNYPAPDSSTSGTAARQPGPVVLEWRTDLIGMAAYRQMEAERDALADRVFSLEIERGAANAEVVRLQRELRATGADLVHMMDVRTGAEAERDAARTRLLEGEAAHKQTIRRLGEVMDERDAATARAEKAERQRDHARAWCRYRRDLAGPPPAPLDLPDNDLWLP